ncbi:MAG TPA: hypothetical protein VKX28_22115 [Xanthobacteraceae bacterium]|jgi:hypothetical protein|nr:hypothetical protein [Xanthobacteraceae bacterium]
MRPNLATALCLAGVLSLCSFAASAQSDDRYVRDIDTKQRRACTPDVQRLCSQYGNDVDEIVACLTREKANGNLSPACTEVFSTPKQCKADVQSSCKDYLVVIPSVVACLKRNLDAGNLEADCAQAFAATLAPAPAQSTRKPPVKKKK